MDSLAGFLGGAAPGTTRGVEATLLSLLVAFILGQLLAWTYYFTHSGLSYSRSFVQSLILLALVVSMVMSTVANSFVTALGLLGAMALIRFRNMLKDTRDIAFVFGALVAGMAAGSSRFEVAVTGTILVCLCAMYLHWTNFGAHEPLNAFLQFRLARADELESAIAPVLRRFCRTYTLVSARRDPGEDAARYAFQLLLRDPADSAALVTALESIGAIDEIGLTVHEPLLEV